MAKSSKQSHRAQIATRRMGDMFDFDIITKYITAAARFYFAPPGRKLKKERQAWNCLPLRVAVRIGGLEPPLREELDPKSSAATNYAISAKPCPSALAGTGCSICCLSRANIHFLRPQGARFSNAKILHFFILEENFSFLRPFRAIKRTVGTLKLIEQHHILI